VTEALDTLVREHRHEIDPIKGSRFLATVGPASTADEAEAFVARIRAEFANATHHCWAYRVGLRGEGFRCSDDGEPGGTAGRPILAQIEGHGLTNTAVVVTRWYGGTKLGTGGLVRAYGGATGQALDRAERQRLVQMTRLRVEHPYECSGAVTGLLGAWRLEPLEADYGSAVRLVLEIPEERREELTRELTDRTAGRVAIDVVGEAS
jgi:uncharacterized YigZ family protein